MHRSKVTFIYIKIFFLNLSVAEKQNKQPNKLTQYGFSQNWIVKS